MAHEAPPLPPLRELPSELRSRALEAELREADLHLGLALGEWVAERDRAPLVELVAALRLAEREGSSRLPLAGAPFERFADALGLGAGARELAASLAREPERLGSIAGAAGAFRPLTVEHGCLHSQRMRALEERLAAGLAGRRQVSGPSASEVAEALDDVLAHPPLLARQPLVLSAEQQAAVRAACGRGLTAITGGPGTGKTSILVSILRTLARLGVAPGAMVLATPTGKAADRMRAATAAALARIAEPSSADRALLEGLPSAQTLHRLLGFSPRDATFRHHEDDPIGASVVVVDESSMVDLGLADRLVRALPPGARLVLVGDADQLPSVDVGAVFRDLCAAPVDASEAVTVELTHSYRMDASDPAGRSVLEAARAVNAGDADALLARAHERPEALAFAGYERVAPTRLDAFLEIWWERWAQPILRGAATPLYAPGGVLDAEACDAVAERFERMEQARLLAPTRGRRQGVIALNEALHGRACAARDIDPKRATAYGEPLLVTRNDYERHLFNGDQGLVLPVRSERGLRPSAVFRARGGYAAFPLETVRGLTELAWAVTVHKAQGSEHDVVALVLPDAPLPLTTRELIYTALTRARRSVVAIGAEDVLAAAVATRAERFSGLSQRFAQAGRAPSRSGC